MPNIYAFMTEYLLRYRMDAPTLARFLRDQRMTAIFHRFPKQTLPTAVGGRGIYLFDQEGRTYLDGSGGAAVSCLGHAHPDVIAAVTRQTSALAFAHTAFFTNEPAEALAERLIAQAPQGFGKVYFLSGGSEANETALKLARQYQLARGEKQRTVFIARRQSYHGNTLGALSVSGNPARRTAYEPLLRESPKIAPCYAYREQAADESLEQYACGAADELERAINAVGAERVAAFIAEPVVGATLGAVPAAPGYFKRIRDICDRHGVVLIADEVMCGMGRTGTMFAIDHDGVAPDIITIAKGLGGGYQPIGAAIASSKIFDAVVDRFGKFEHGHTYIGHPTACAAALAVQDVIARDNLLEQTRVRGGALEERLRARFGEHRFIGDIRGRGLFWGLEIVADRNSKAPFPSSDRIAARIQQAGMAQGLICYPGAGCVDGVLGDHVMVAPPYIIEDGQLDELVDKLALTLADVLGG